LQCVMLIPSYSVNGYSGYNVKKERRNVS